ncbi:MAG TPA: RNA methyltransferase [Bacteroidales bacterium]|jgi:TrmH family RNA methyltransferase|nr:RNA methyltransferase [Bacteroidales bacterium]MDI9573437.1 RNA methyltransferase [Bacteroidota bacterium]OQC61868.1 MAG: 23S rRNA (uridine(2479)-2'-O)-methyltransferase [Bacteroidetes bacterium ADurb.Bin012]MBP9511240.1 RNA methyltransferase [Bacteroidales bacterium]MBP9587661.1 RNA methyltransferase [Bacteroidales bacterium]
MAGFLSMLSHQQIAFIRKLKEKSFRYQEGVFLAEGEKLVTDLLQSGCMPMEIYFIESYKGPLTLHPRAKAISSKEMEGISQLKTTSTISALFPIPSLPQLNTIIFKDEWGIVLDDISDPGNMGTLLRTADWFGIRYIVCSSTTVDVYNSKCVQASMGSIARTYVYYLPLDEFFATLPNEVKIFGAQMNGHSIYTTNFPKGGLLLLGSESSGIHPEYEHFIHKSVAVPAAKHNLKQGPESLNVAIAGSIILSEINQQHFSA